MDSRVAIAMFHHTQSTAELLCCYGSWCDSVVLTLSMNMPEIDMDEKTCIWGMLFLATTA